MSQKDAFQGNAIQTGQTPKQAVSAFQVGAFQNDSFSIEKQSAKALQMGVGAFAHTGYTTTLSVFDSGGQAVSASTYRLETTSGTFTQTRYPALFKQTEVLTYATFTLSGKTISLFPSLSKGTFTFGSNATGLNRGYTLTCAQATFTLIGVDATLTYDAGTNNYTLTCEQATFTLGSNATALNLGRILSCAQATFSLTGVAVPLNHGYTLTCAQQTYLLTGNTVTMFRGFAIALTAQAFTLTGPPPNLLRGLLFSTSPQQTFVLTAYDTTLTYTAGFFIESVDGDDIIFDGQTGVIILPKDGNPIWAASGNRVTVDQGAIRRNQLVTAESTTSITITANLAGMTPGSIRLYVHRPRA